MELISGRSGYSFYAMLPVRLKWTVVFAFASFSNGLRWNTNWEHEHPCFPSKSSPTPQGLCDLVRVKLDIARPCISDTDWIWKNVHVQTYASGGGLSQVFTP